VIAAVMAVAIVATFLMVRRPHLFSPAATPPVQSPAVTATKAVVNVSFVETPQAWWLLVSDASANSTLYRSTDAGKHWTATYTTRQLIRIPYPNGTSLTEPELIVETQDGPRTTTDGVHWTTPLLPQGWNVNAISYFPNGQDGWTIGSHGPRATAAILRTNDGGVSWTAVQSSSPGGAASGQALYNTVFFDPLTGFIALNSESIADDRVAASTSQAFVSHDGGSTWIACQLPAGTTAIVGALVAGGQSGVLAVRDGTGRLRIARSTDGGVHWSDTGISASVDSVDLVGPSAWITWAHGGNTISVTSDGGRTFASRDIPLPAGMTSGIVSVRASDARHWLVDISDGEDAGHHALLATSDGGATWTPIQIPG
jgi:hypothetical protein